MGIPRPACGKGGSTKFDVTYTCVLSYCPHITISVSSALEETHRNSERTRLNCDIMLGYALLNQYGAKAWNYLLADLKNLELNDNEFKANLKEFVSRNVDVFSNLHVI